MSEKENYKCIQCGKIETVAEVNTSLEFDWSRPAMGQMNYIAMSRNRVWWAFVAQPERREHGWHSQNGCLPLLPDYEPKNFVGEWEQSLFVRPGSNNE